MKDCHNFKYPSREASSCNPNHRQSLHPVQWTDNFSIKCTTSDGPIWYSEHNFMGCIKQNLKQRGKNNIEFIFSNKRFFLIWYRETSDTGCLAAPSGLTTASLLGLGRSIVGLSYFQYYSLLLQNFACKYTVLTVMFLNYCCDKL